MSLISSQKGSGLVIIGAIVLVVLLLLGLFFLTYNGFVSKEVNVQEKNANLLAQYQRRFDLIPNLQATVKGVSNYESSTLEEVVRLRTQWQTTEGKTLETANQFESALSKLLIINENYPELKATQAYQDFMAELVGTENRVNFARTEYNQAVKEYNNAVRQLPDSLIASMFGFKEKPYFELKNAAAEDAPKVDFN